MLEPVVGFFDKLIDQFTWRRFLALAILLLAGAAGLVGYETYTQHFKLGRIERQVAVLERIAVVSARPEVASSPPAAAFAAKLQRELTSSSEFELSQYKFPDWARKVLAAAAVWSLMGLVLVLASTRYASSASDNYSLVGGVAVVALPFIMAAPAMPTDPTLNYVLYPVATIVLALVVGALLSWFVRRRVVTSRPG